MNKLAIGLIMAIAIFTLRPDAAVAQADDSILSDSYITQQSFVEAEVISVNLAKRTVTVKGEKRGETRKFVVPENTRIRIDGERARLRDLRLGDNIMLTFVNREEQVTVAEIRMPDPDVPLEARREEPQTVAQVLPAMLPKTASFWPIVLIGGVLALFTAAAVRRMRA